MTVDKEESMTTYSDPAMVMVGLSRQTWGGGSDGVSLFGSSVKNNNVIALTIYQAEVNRHLSHDWYTAKSPIIEVVLSPLQFAELITTMNIGFGVPGTLVRHNGEYFKFPKMPSKTEQFKEEISGDMKAVIDKLNEAGQVIEGLIDDPKPIGKQVRKQLKALVNSLRETFENKLPFIINQFGKQMARTATEAKAEVDAFVDHEIAKTGIEELRKQNPKLLIGNPETKEKGDSQ
jgi:hypothetical protein